MRRLGCARMCCCCRCVGGARVLSSPVRACAISGATRVSAGCSSRRRHIASLVALPIVEPWLYCISTGDAGRSTLWRTAACSLHAPCLTPLMMKAMVRVVRCERLRSDDHDGCSLVLILCSGCFWRFARIHPLLMCMCCCALCGRASCAVRAPVGQPLMHKSAPQQVSDHRMLQRTPRPMSASCASISERHMRSRTLSKLMLRLYTAIDSADLCITCSLNSAAPAITAAAGHRRGPVHG
jgi:hypothetical protein